jgi:8-oxo-dGTP pyrophosphatase MutT (NUDIX family)
MSSHFAPKAGLIPYIIDPKDNQLKMLFMVASNPKFGGPKPMISKGTIEDGEDVLTAAIREAGEELGLREDNIKGQPFKVWEGFVSLRTSKYDLTVFAVEIKDKTSFDKWDHETLYATWMTNDSFQEKGRRDHKNIVQLLVDMLK